MIEGLAGPEKPGIDNPALRYVGGAVFVLFLIGCVVGGVLAFTGRWRSWYPHLFITPYTPLVMPWLAGGFLIMSTAGGLHLLLDPIPLFLAIPLIAGGVLAMLIGGVYVVPPRRLLPRWIRELQ
jgi:hypothetical protein